MAKVVVITGASGGIGAALARQLARGGLGEAGEAGERVELVLAARRAPELRAVAEASGARAVVADVTLRADVERIRDEAIGAFGRVDVWINNAGRGIGKSVLDLTDDDVDDMMTTNLKSALYGMQAIVPHFQARGDGHVVNVSSFLGRVPLASIRSVYSASKAALNTLTANLRMDLAETHPGLRVSLVMPGLVATDFAANVRRGAPVSSAGPGGAAPPPPRGALAAQSAEEVASAIAALIAHPVAEIYTNPALAELARRYLADVGAFEAGMAKR
jgi:NADP-dependent 3-hydroxy acid dehydrogenase YdfG